MDLRLYFRVMWRFKWLVAMGVLLAIALSILSFMAPNFSGTGPMLQYRQGEEWVTYSELFVTPEGFPWGQVVSGSPVKPTKASRDEAPTGDANRFSNLAVL